MADNVTIPATGTGTATPVVATDDVGGVHFQKIKLDLGGDGASVPVAGQVPVAGDIANDAVDSGNPMKIGGIAVAHNVNIGAVAAADRVNAKFNRHGIQFVIGGHPNILTLEAEYTAAQTNTAIISVSAGTKVAVTRILATLDEACTVGVGFRVGFGTSTTPTTSGVVLSHPGLIPGGGIVSGDGSAILGIGQDDEDLRITSEVATGGTIRIVTSYFLIES